MDFFYSFVQFHFTTNQENNFALLLDKYKNNIN